MVGGPLGWGPLKNQPHIHFISRGYLLGISPFKGLLGGLKQLGYHPRVVTFSLWQIHPGRLPAGSPENDLFEKKNHLKQASIFLKRVLAVDFQGCMKGIRSIISNSRPRWYESKLNKRKYDIQIFHLTFIVSQTLYYRYNFSMISKKSINCKDLPSAMTAQASRPLCHHFIANFNHLRLHLSIESQSGRKGPMKSRESPWKFNIWARVDQLLVLGMGNLQPLMTGILIMGI